MVQPVDSELRVVRRNAESVFLPSREHVVAILKGVLSTAQADRFIRYIKT